MIELLKRLYQGVKPGEIDEALHAKLAPFLTKQKNLTKLSNNLLFGKIDINKSGTGFLEPIGVESDRDLIVEAADLMGAFKKDIVLAKHLKKRRGREAAKVLAIIKRSKDFSICVLKNEKGVKRAYDIKNETFVLLDVNKRELKPLPEGTILKVDLANNQIVEVLGHIDSPQVDEKISLALYDKQEVSPKEAQTEAKAFGKEVFAELYPDRADLRKLNFCTIDPATAKDHDDAIFYDEKNSDIYVAIADVSEYVQPFTAIDKEAKRRGFSIYLPHKSIPMLPRELSENICSLKEGVDRLAYVFKIKIDRRNLKIKEEALFKAVISSKRSFTYEEVDTFLEGEKEERFFSKNLVKLYALTSKIRKKRLGNAFEFENSDTRLEVDENQNLVNIHVEKETPSHKLVEECMLLANVAASKRFKRGIFRVHEKPDMKKLEDLLIKLATIGISPKIGSDTTELISSAQEEANKFGLREEVDRLIIRSMKQARYDATNVGHFGLGFESYTHFTSPIRRYSDLILHRLLKSIEEERDKDKKFILKDIDEVSAKISELEREAAKVEWDYMDRKFARWAKAHQGEELKVVVADVEFPAIAMVKDKLFGARVFIKDRIELYLLDKLIVKIMDVDLLQAKIFVKVLRVDGES